MPPLGKLRRHRISRISQLPPRRSTWRSLLTCRAGTAAAPWGDARLLVGAGREQQSGWQLGGGSVGVRTLQGASLGVKKGWDTGAKGPICKCVKIKANLFFSIFYIFLQPFKHPFSTQVYGTKKKAVARYHDLEIR